MTLCHACHAQTDAPYARGRLVVTPLGAGRFDCEVVRARSKWTRGNGPTDTVPSSGSGSGFADVDIKSGPLKIGSSGGRRSSTRTVIRTAKTAPENALNRSGVAARSTVASCCALPPIQSACSHLDIRFTFRTHSEPSLPHGEPRGPSSCRRSRQGGVPRGWSRPTGPALARGCSALQAPVDFGQCVSNGVRGTRGLRDRARRVDAWRMVALVSERALGARRPVRYRRLDSPRRRPRANI